MGKMDIQIQHKERIIHLRGSKQAHDEGALNLLAKMVGML